MITSPPPIPLTAFGHINILRGDMIEGSLKTLALLKYLPKLNHHHFAYVGSVYGSGAWAVATACATLGYQCTLFIAKSDHLSPWRSHIEKTGATLQWVNPSPVTHIHHMITTQHPEFYNLPLGFDTPDFIKDMADILHSSIPLHTSELWMAAVSGVLVRAACIAFPDIPVHAVLTAKHVSNIDRAIQHAAPEKFHRPAVINAPYPACPYSCEKVWRFAQVEAKSHATIINVGY